MQCLQRNLLELHNHILKSRAFMRKRTHGEDTFCFENHTRNPHTGEWMCSVPIRMMNREPFVIGCARCDERRCLVISARMRENRLCLMAVVIIFAILVSFACWQNQPTKVDGAGSSSGATAGSAWHRGGGSTPPTISGDEEDSMQRQWTPQRPCMC